MSEQTRGFGPAVTGIAAVGVVVLVLAVWWSRSPAPPAERATDPGEEVAELPPLERPVAGSPEPDALRPEVDLADQAQDLAGERGVVCRLEPRIGGGTARLVLDGEPGTWLAVAAAQAHVLVLTDIPESGSGTLLIEGFAPAPIAWTDARGGAGRCDPDPVELEAAEGAVVGTVVGLRRSVGVTACGQRVVLDAEGDFYASAVPGVPCEVELRRHFGVWEWVHQQEVLPRRGVDTVVRVEAPEFEAVLPLVVEAGEILAVWGPSEAPGLVGGRIVEVDGEPVPGDATGFHETTGGAEATVARITVERGGRTETVELERRALGFEDWLAH